MRELIDKAAIVAKIKTIYNEDYKFLPSDLVEGVQDFKDDLLIALDTLEVKEVDLDIWTDNDYDKVKSIEYLLHEFDNHNFDDWFNSLKERIGE